ncbi:TonB-dependent receptor [Segetibacter sp. 3557_3]|uniref:outer membrane beta-barrel family protein n=1 Tax=Segetibacter sp. 3557_3 TaxID=2547429 RepID=UPI001058B40A|nr:outer membrane beta-barrel family protein [Segetibacter sp. 3557_3]TDH27369.1 TonB-dependent receptor [Segetibacter sp. 3557_3]
MRKLVLVAFLLSGLGLSAQPPGMRPGAGRGGGQQMNTGHFYGKVVDSKTNKAVDGASIILLSNGVDSATKKSTQATIKTAISANNGDFSLSNLPVFGNFTLRVSAIGFKQKDQALSFGLRPGPGANQEQMMSMIDRDLGNIKLEQDAATLSNVTVTATRRLFEMGVDRKIFNVDRNLVSTGQTATEVMKNIPSLSVDIDGNVTMRNASPQLFVDGRPTTLTMDQIPADIIDRVELITNPSAKFDASGGNAGILNIVLKKNRKTGYNGGIRAGIDSRARVNLGGDINLRQNKLNFFLSGSLNQRKSKSWATTDRQTLTTPLSEIHQTSEGIGKNLFGFARGGFDYFIDIRNTISVTANYNRGNFLNDDDQRIDSTINKVFSSYSDRITKTDGNFRNLGSQLSYKHLFSKPGHELTADVNYNLSKNDNIGNFRTETFGASNRPKALPILQRTAGSGQTKNLIFQADYENPISDKQKLELGARASIRDFENINNQFFYDYNRVGYVLFPNISSSYSFTDRVYAAYGTYSLQVNRISYQFGLRAESSTYQGNLAGKDSSFNVDFPLSLFPSTFITYKLTDNQDLQLNYSRRINRPNFFQLMPFIDYSDPQNLSVGNAGLRPEFTNSLEVSYNYNYQRAANLLVSTFFKQNDNLITRFQYVGKNPIETLDSAVFNTYINANNSQTYGVEVTNRMPLAKWWDMTVNVNVFNSTIKIAAQAGQPALTNQRTSWFAKINNSIKLPKGFAIQLSGDYFAKTVLPQEGGRGGGGGGPRGGGGGGGFMFGGGGAGTAQGYINPRYSVDLAIRKDFTLKGGNTASLNLSVNDIFRTQLFSTYSESPYFFQTSERRRDPQIVRLNFNYRFGKFDVNLFKRKNDRSLDSGEGMQQ